jgi:hypothetical protein
MSDQSPTVTILTTDGTQWFVGSGASGAPGPAGPTGPPGSAGCTLQFSGTGQELVVPYGDDGVSSVTYNIVRVNVRLSGSSIGTNVEVTGYDGTGEYIGSTLCTVFVPGAEYEGYINPSSVTVSSGQKISISADLYTDESLWVGVQLVPA